MRGRMPRKRTWSSSTAETKQGALTAAIMEATSGEDRPHAGGGRVWNTNRPRTVRRLNGEAAFTGQSRKTATLLKVASSDRKQGYASVNGRREREPFAHMDSVTREARSLPARPSGEGPAPHHPPDSGAPRTARGVRREGITVRSRCSARDSVIGEA